jgi:hypothetical protein
VGTNGAGLARLAGGRWGRLGTDQGLPDNHIDAILRDDSGKLWIATNSGLFGAAEQDFIAAAEGSVPFLHGAALHVKDGLPSSDFLGGAQSAAARSADGTLWFISEKGVVGIDPKLGTRSPAPPPVHIEQVVVDGQVKEASEGLRLGPGARTLEFRFVGIDFLNPAGTSYRYRLDGFDRDWVEGGRQRRATYTNLPPGSYTFRVQAVNSTGVWNRSGAALRLTLLPLFRQTRWFAGLCIFLAGAVVFGLYRWRMWKLRRRERELQVRVDEALAQAHVLSGLLPICAGCKKIRDDKGYWNQIEIYIRDHTDASFSHGICPDCSERMYGNFLHPHGPGADPAQP